MLLTASFQRTHIFFGSFGLSGFILGAAFGMFVVLTFQERIAFGNPAFG